MGEGTCWEYANGQTIYGYEKHCPQGFVCPCPGDIYMYITIIFKHQSQTLSGASLGKGSES